MAGCWVAILGMLRASISFIFGGEGEAKKAEQTQESGTLALFLHSSCTFCGLLKSEEL